MRIRNRRTERGTVVLLALLLALVGWSGTGVAQARTGAGAGARAGARAGAADQPVTVCVHYDTGFGNNLTIRGDTGP